jgi:hypothetical protein
MVLEAENEKGTLTSFFNKKQPPPPMDSNIKRDENPQEDEVIINDDQPALAERMEHTPLVEQPNVALDAAGNPLNAIQASKQPSNSKKRKGRLSILDTVTEEQAAALEVFYSSHPKRGSINNTNKAELASRIGLDTSKITTWIEHRRKKAKAEATASPTLPIQQQQQQPSAPPSAHLLPPTSVPPSTAVAPSLPAAGNYSIQILLEPSTEVKRTIVDASGTIITPAPALAAPHSISRQQIPEQQAPPPQQQPHHHQQQQPVHPHPPPAATATAVELPSGFPTSIDQIEQFKADFCIEIANLKTKGLSPPLISLDSDACLSVQPFTDVLLAKHVVGQRTPRSALIATLRPLFTIAVQTNTTAITDADGTDGGQQKQQASTVINTAVPEDLLLARLLDIATRRSYAPKSNNTNKGGKSRVLGGIGGAAASSSFSAPLTKDPLDDDSPDMLWQWELRDVKLLANKDTRSKAVAIKKRAAKVQERLCALQFALEVFGEYKPLPSDRNAGKAVRAFTNLAKTVSFESMENEMKNEESVVVAKQQETEEAAHQRALLKAKKEAEKERLRLEKEAEREKLRAEKEAEKERLRVEKEAEKERLRVEKEAEKEQSKQQKNAQKIVKQTGFKDTKQLERSKNKFMQFFGKALQAGAAITTTTTTDNNNNNNNNNNNDDDDDISQGQDGQQQQQQQQQPASPQSQGTGSASRPRLPKKKRTYQDLFLKPTPDTVFPQPTFSSLVDSMDSALFGSTSTDMVVDLTGGQEEEEEQGQQQQRKKEMMEVVPDERTVLQDWQSTVDQWKQNKRTAAQHKSTSIPLGLPPTWSRIPGSEGLQLASAAVNQHLDFGFHQSTIKTYRRKFLWFESDSKRPPFYGSFSKINKDIRPRHYWGRDDELDYEVMSDLEWEEEPDGSSLSEADSDEEDDEEAGLFGSGGSAAGELEDSEFIKPDGYLSEDEGVGLEEGDDDDDDGGGGSSGGNDVTMRMVDDNEAGTTISANMDTVGGMMQKKRIGLEMQMDRARKCHKPLFISRLPTTATTPPISELQHQQPQVQAASFIEGDVSLLEGICWEVLVPGAVIEMPPDPAQVAAAAAAVAAQAQASIAGAKLLNGSSLPVGTGTAQGATTITAATTTNNALGAGAVGGGGEGGGPTGTNTTKTTMERPEELVPSLLSILQSNPKRGGDKIIEEFIAAHQGRKIVKKWALTRLKEHAAYVKNQWQLNEKGLAFLGVLSSGAAGGDGIALQHQEQQPATAGPLVTAFLKSAPPTTATAPAGTPIKNDATNVGMNEQVPLSSWKNYWQRIVRSIEHNTDDDEDDDIGRGEECDIDMRVASAFAPREKLVNIIGDIPAFVVSALVGSLLQHPKGVVAESLSSIVDVLVGDGGGGGLNNSNGGDNVAATTTTTATTTITAPSQQQVFAQRTGPARVSLSGLCGEPFLMDALVRCLDVDACRQPALMMVKKLMLLEEVRNGVGGVGQLSKVVEKVQKEQSMMVSQGGGENNNNNNNGLDLGAAMSLANEVVDLAGSFGVLSSSP